MEAREADSVMFAGVEDGAAGWEERAPFGGPVGGIGLGSAWVWWVGELR